MNSLFAKPISNSEPWILKLVDSYSQRITSLNYVKELYLFGSLVRDEFTDGSDLDFFVVLENSTSVKTFYEEFSSKGLGWPADVLAMNEQNFQMKREVGGIAQEVSESGRLLFSR